MKEHEIVIKGFFSSRLVMCGFVITFLHEGKASNLYLYLHLYEFDEYE